jgi:hypothetical protein
MSDVVTLEGPVHTWSLNDTTRRFLVATVPFSVARKVLRACPFSAVTGQGEQRRVQDAHARRLREEMDAGNYTPTPVAAGLRPAHRQLVEEHAGAVRLPVRATDPLPLTDGFQRLSAMEDLLRRAEGDDARVRAVLALPVTLVVYLDGDTQQDFINLNRGKPVDPSHLFSLELSKGEAGGKHGPAVHAAVDAARRLHEAPASPFFGGVRFEDAAPGGVPVTTLCATGGSDLSTSLVGVVLAAETDGAGAAALVTEAYKTLSDGAPELLVKGRLLCPPRRGGRKGSATLLSGVAAVVGYRSRGRGLTAGDRERLVAAARQTLGDSAGGNLSAQRKRELMREFAAAFLAGAERAQHRRLPVGLLAALSCSAYAVPPLPKPKAEPKPPAVKPARRKPEPALTV